MDKLEVTLSGDQLMAFRIAKAFVWGEAAQLILDNIDLHALDLRKLCLGKMHQGLEQVESL